MENELKNACPSSFSNCVPRRPLFTHLICAFQDPREALIVSLKREVNILHQENNHLRQLLELADSDSAMSVLPQESSVSVMAQLGMDKNGTKEPLDGRGNIITNLLPLFFTAKLG